MSSTATSNPVVNILESFCVAYTPFIIMFLMFLFFLSSLIVSFPPLDCSHVFPVC